MKEVFDQYQSIIIQIATPQSTGTGFYLKEQNLIVTNNHVVEGNKEAIIEGKQFKKQMSKVVYSDAKFDLAFLEAPKNVELPLVHLGTSIALAHGDIVGAIGHPFGLKYTTHDGIVSNLQHVMNDIRYLQHSAAINPGNSGGPLVNKAGQVVGINTFIIGNSNNIGFALPAEYLEETLMEFKKMESFNCARCVSCAILVSEKTIEAGYCTNCGTKINLPGASEAFISTGVAKNIEDLIIKAGHEVSLSRRGPSSWEVKQGSAKIDITYHEKTGLIVADAFLAQLPKDNIKPIYEYLLRQNYELENLTLSVHDQDIILSLLIYDRHLSQETGSQMLQKIFEKADYYDNILVEEYGAKWKIDEL
jgi:serine protease Do